MPQRLLHAFSRDLDVLKRLWSRSRLRSLGLWVRRQGRIHRRTSPHPTPGRRQPERRRRAGRAAPRLRLPARASTGGLLCSIAIHALLLAVLLPWILPARPPGKSDEPLVVQVRLRHPPEEPETRPEPQDRPEPEPEPLEEAPAEEPEPVDQAGAKEPSRASPGSGEETSSDAPARVRERLIGLGPPPLDLGKGPGGGVHGREGRRAKAVARGGSGATENAVDRGLRWLAEHQDPDGRWDLEHFARHCVGHTPCEGKGLSEFDVGGSALALLAFLGGGHRPGVEGPYRRNIEGAIKSLISGQASTGALGWSSHYRHYMYNHALASFALAEAHAADRRSSYREPLLAALSFSRRVQQSTGGWDYRSEPTGRSDLSITGWQIMAMRSAERSGIPLPAGMVEDARRFVRWAFTDHGYGIYANKGPEAGRRGINMTAVGLLSHLYLDGKVGPGSRLAAERILRQPPDWQAAASWDETYQSYYYWYAATLGLFHLGGERWEAWNHMLKRTLLPLQESDPHRDGSWPPEPSWIGQSGGRVYATAINVLTLEVYYRYEPLHALRKN